MKNRYLVLIKDKTQLLNIVIAEIVEEEMITQAAFITELKYPDTKKYEVIQVTQIT